MQIPEKGNAKGKGKQKQKQDKKSCKNHNRRGLESDNSNVSSNLGNMMVFKGNHPITDNDDKSNIARPNRKEAGSKDKAKEY